MPDVITILRDHRIQPTPQRIAVAGFILGSVAHPSADQVFEQVLPKCPTLSRATVYNTLNLMVEKGLVRPQILKEGTVVFDANVAAHHHFIDEETGEVFDVPWDALSVTGERTLEGFEVREYHVVLRGKKKKQV
jgi:Fe2+ or Zn2+ uptake regulation protein